MKTTLITAVAFSLALAFAQDQAQHIGGIVMQSQLASTVTPVYPALAKQQGVEGTVRFDATIDKGGHVADLKVLSGPPLLVQSAMDAVKQWVYKPTYLNGEPISVLTTIDVNFSLTQ
jgi:periplasmic protein TonB